MSSTINKIISVLLWVLMGLSVVFGIMFFAGGDIPETAASQYPEPIYTELILKWTYVLFFITTVLLIVFPIVSMITNPKSAIQTLGAIVMMGILAAISYAISGDEILVFPGSETMNITHSLSKTVGMGLITTYFLFFIAFVGIIVTEVTARFK